MHILVVRSNLPDMGPGTQALTVAKQMRERGHTVSFATSGGVLLPAVVEAGFDVHIVPELAHDRHDLLSVAKGIAKLAQIIRIEKPAVIHGHNAAATICGWLAGLSTGRRLPCVTSVRGVEERETHNWRNQIWKRVPGVLLGVCEKTRSRLMSFGVPDDRIVVTYNGVDTNKFVPSAGQRTEHRALLGLDDNDVVLGSVGAMLAFPGCEGAGKGQHLLVRAAARLKDKHPNLKLLLVGDGSGRPLVEEITREEGMQDRVLFVGQRFDTPQLLNAMDIYGLASTQGEFFPNSIVEAMCMHLPWIGSDIAGLSELTADDEAGWVVPIGDVDALADRLDRLVSDPALRKSRGDRGRREVLEKLTIEKVAQRILGAFRKAGAKAEVVGV